MVYSGRHCSVPLDHIVLLVVLVWQSVNELEKLSRVCEITSNVSLVQIVTSLHISFSTEIKVLHHDVFQSCFD